MRVLKKIINNVNIPLVVFLLIVGSLITVSNIKSAPVEKAKETVNSTVNKVSEKLNNAAKSDGKTVG